MARNRRSEAGFRLAPACAALALCALFVTLGVGYVWFKNQIGVLGGEIKKRETQLSELQRENRVRRDQLAVLTSPIALDDRVKKLNLGLGPPALSRIVRITEYPPAPPAFQRPAPQAEPRLAQNAPPRRDN